MKRITSIGLAIAAFGIMLGLFAPQTVHAAPIPTSCHGFGVQRAGVETWLGETYSYSHVFQNPSWSGCKDINISWIDNLDTPQGQPAPPHLESCAYFRVRFYPSSGGSYTNNWKYVCQDENSTQTDTIATDVKNNTRYRIETSGNINFSYYVWD